MEALAAARGLEIQKIEAAVAPFRDDAALQRETAQALLAIGELATALNFADGAVLLDPLAENTKTSAESLSLRALIYQKQGDVERAYEDSRQACRLAPGHSSACQTALMTRGRINPKQEQTPPSLPGKPPPGASALAAASGGSTSSGGLVSRGKGLRLTPVPAPGSKPDALSRIEALPYEPRIKRYLAIMARVADPEDAESTLSALERFKPALHVRDMNVRLPFHGIAHRNYQGHEYKPSIHLIPGYAAPPEGGAGMGGRYSALQNPESPREDLGFVDGPESTGMPTAARLMNSDEQIAGTLMHEILHVRRVGGGGDNAFRDESDAFDIAFRFYTRYQQKNSGAINLDRGSAALAKWQSHPDEFAKIMAKTYEQVGIKSVKAGKEALDRPLTKENSNLTKDLILHERADRAHQDWRDAREREFRQWATRFAAAAIRKIDGMPEATPGRKAKKAAALAAIDRYAEDSLRAPWRHLTRIDPEILRGGAN